MHDNKKYYLGHRQRVKDKLFRCVNNNDIVLNYFDNYEIVELILFLALPRKDVKPLAKKLLEEFGSLNKLLAAPIDHLNEITGKSVAIVLKTFFIVNTLALKEQIEEKSILNSWDQVINYCYATMANSNTEILKVLFLNYKNRIMKEEMQLQGSNNHIVIDIQAILKKALLINADKIILIHNHPDGNASPSKSDIATTYELQAASKQLNIYLYDHIIISHNNYYSFRQDGLL